VILLNNIIICSVLLITHIVFHVTLCNFLLIVNRHWSIKLVSNKLWRILLVILFMNLLNRSLITLFSYLLVLIIIFLSVGMSCYITPAVYLVVYALSFMIVVWILHVLIVTLSRFYLLYFINLFRFKQSKARTINTIDSIYRLLRMSPQLNGHVAVHSIGNSKHLLL